MPGLRLTAHQARRLWHLPAEVCDAALAALVSEGFLARSPDGSYGAVATGRVPAPAVLLVDDDRDAREMYSASLRAARLQPLEAADAAEGLEQAQAAHVVVTGIRLPGAFDGLELVRRVRADEHIRHTPVIVLTASALPGYEEQARSAGCSAFLAKPCLPDTLVREVRRLLAGRVRRVPLTVRDIRNRWPEPLDRATVP